MQKDDNGRNTLDREQAVTSLSRGFENATQHLGPKAKAVRDGDPRKPGPTKGSALYEHQVEFAYLLDEIMRGPEATAWQAFAQAKQLLAEISESKAESEEAA